MTGVFAPLKRICEEGCLPSGAMLPTVCQDADASASAHSTRPPDRSILCALWSICVSYGHCLFHFDVEAAL